MIQKLSQGCKEICTASLARETITILNLYAPKLVPKVGESIDEFIERGNPVCSLHKDKRAYCKYCFADFILEKLKKMKVNSELREKFLILFSSVL